MGSEIPDYYNKTLASENNTVATRNSGFPVWEDYKGSVDDLQYFLIGLYTFYILPLVCLTVSHTSVCRTISCGLSSQDSKLEENEMINLTLQPAKRSGPQAKLSHHPKWTYSFIRRHRRRYSKKTACVRPAPAGPALESREGRPPGKVGSMQSQPPPSNKFMPGVPTCFEVKPEENSDVPEMRVSRSIMRLRKRSRSVFYRLTVLILVFAVSWMPLHLFHVVTDFNDNLISNRHFKLVYCICHLLGMMSCCLNPILYGFLNNGIKADLMSLIHCLHVS